MIKKITACILSAAMFFSVTAFAATPAGHWFEGSVAEVSEFYPQVTSDGFDPDGYITYKQFASVATNVISRAIAYSTDLSYENITRYDILRLICERMEYADLTEEEEVTTALSIADFNTMPQEYKQIALISVKNGLVCGDENGMLNLGEKATYAEALVILSRVY